MIQFAVFYAFLHYIFRVFNYIAIFLPQPEEEDPETGSVFGEKRKMFSGWPFPKNY